MSPRGLPYLRFVALLLAAVLVAVCVGALVEGAISMGSDACVGATCELQIACRPEVLPPQPGSWHVPVAALSDNGDGVVRQDGPGGSSIAPRLALLPGGSAGPLAARAPPARA